MISNPFKAVLAAGPGPRPLGTWLMSGAPSTAEALGFCGFDFLVLDMEHVPIGIPEAAAILRAIEVTPAAPLVRLAWNDTVLVKRVMDAGARALMFPFIQSVEEAVRAVAATRYPPEGVRGVAAVHRGSRYGQSPDYLKSANAAVSVVLQLETPEAVLRAKEIAAVEHVESLFLGPGDLSAAMNRIGEIGHPEVQDMIRRAAEAAHAAGKPIGIVGPNPQMVSRFLEYGYDWAAVASDMGMMTGRAAEWLSSLRGTVAAQASAPY